MENIFKKEFVSKKTFIISKLAKEKLQSFSNDLEMCFDNPDTYLADSYIIVGKRIIGPRYDSNNKVIPRTVVGSPNQFNRHNNINFKDIEKLRKQNSIEKIDHNEPNQFQRVNEDQLIKYSKEIDQRLQQGKINEFLINLPNETKVNLFKQEKALKRSIIIQDEKKTLERVLSNRSNKKPLELLMNRTGSFHQINQIKDKIELQKPFEERFRKHGWIMGLRRCKDSKAPRYGFVEIKGQTHPIWSTIIDRSKEREKIIQNNCMKIKEVDRFMRSDYFKSKSRKFSFNYENLEVHGKNLFREESNSLQKINGSVILNKNYIENGNSQTFTEKYMRSSKSSINFKNSIK